MICPKCNSENQDDVRFCVNCGTELSTENLNESTQVQVPVSEPQKPAQSPAVPAQPTVIINQTAPARTPSNGLSVAALVCGLIGIIGSFIPVVKYFTLVLAVLGIVFGVLGKKKAAQAGSTNTGLATAGLVLGIIGTAFSAVGVICALACVGAANAAADSGIAQDVLSSAADSVKESATSAVSELADKIASSAADKANEIASSAADKAAQAASDAADSFVKSLFS